MPQVRSAVHVVTKQRVAIKIISRSRMSEEAGAEDKGARRGASQVLQASSCSRRVGAPRQGSPAAWI